MSELDSKSAADSAVSRLREMVGGFRVTQLIHVAAKLGIADLLSDGPKTCAEMAEQLDVDAFNLHRTLRALASLGVFTENADGAFALNRLAEPLRSEAPSSVRPFAIMQGDPCMWQPMGELLHCVRTGEVAFDRLFGKPFFRYLAEHDELGPIFDQNLTNRSRREAAALLGAYDFSRYETVVDVGGGQGNTMALLLQEHPQMSGVVLDMPSVMPGARTLVEAAGVAERCELIGGTFFDRLPTGGDLYLLQAILHDWDDEHAAVILRRCREAMDEEARLLVVDTIIAPGNEPEPVKLSEVTIMAVLGGRDRSEEDFRSMLEAAGFRPLRFLSAPPRTLIEAVPV